jgi:hypothetical protein
MPTAEFPFTSMANVVPTGQKIFGGFPSRAHLKKSVLGFEQGIFPMPQAFSLVLFRLRDIVLY